MAGRSVMIACLVGLSATSSTRVQPPTADSVFTRYYRAIGGLDRLLAVSSRRMWGTYVEGTLIARTDIAWARPESRRVNIHAPGFEYAEGYDGQTWQFNFQTRQLVVDTGAAADAGRRGAEFDESFVGYRQKGHGITMLGAQRFGGHETIGVRVRLADGWTKDYWFDKESGLIGVIGSFPLHDTFSSEPDVWIVQDGL